MPRQVDQESRKKSKPYERPSKRAGPSLGSTGNDINVGRPATNQSSRKGKKAWRKNVDISLEESALEQAREDERAVGRSIAEKPNEDLFVEDTVGDVQMAQRLRRTSKPLRSLAVLSERSAVPSFTSRPSAASSSKSQPAHVSSAEKARLRRIARRSTNVHEGEKLHSADVKVSANALKDAWINQRERQLPGGFGQEATVRRPVKTPTTLAKRREMQRRDGPVPKEGASWNPPAQSHSRLLDDAAEEEADLQAREIKEVERTRAGEEIMNARRDAVVGELAPGMAVGPGEAGDAEEADQEVTRTVKSTRRKTQAQRNKAIRLKEEARLARLEATEKKLRRSVGDVPTLKALADQRRAAMIEAERMGKVARRERERLGYKGGEKIGKHFIAKGRVDVQLGDDLAESLRQMKPEGNLFRDRFVELQQRALLEPRTPQLPKKKTRRVKEYEKHAYKRFT